LFFEKRLILQTRRT